VIALVRMRVYGYVRTGRILAPLLACLVMLGTLYGGGAAQAGEAYGVSALLLFPILAWQTKLLLDAEPDVQRRLARVAVGSAGRELAAGLVAAIVVAIPLVAFALVLPWAIGGVQGPVHPEDPSLGSGVAAGLWAHLIVIPPAVALGAWASRAMTRSFGTGAMVLVGGAVLTIVLGLRGSPLGWVAPPMMPVTRLATHGFVLSGVASISVHALLWTAAAVAAYAWVRRTRA
jgi:hypothetical protein